MFKYAFFFLSKETAKGMEGERILKKNLNGELQNRISKKT
jgi:hypothetical protein